ncbi:MAG: ATP-binding protein [Acidobacteria bacterium]|nr:ATP-binding protein [Acidobacteriota bacterium]
MPTKGRRTTDVDRVLQSLGALPAPRSRPALVLVAGLPGTGKSQFSRELTKRTNAVILESDAVRRLLFGRPVYSWLESRRVFAALHRAIEKLLEGGISCIVDATSLAEAYRHPLYDIAEKRGAKLIVVEVTAPEEVVVARLSKRGGALDNLSDADIAIYERMRPNWEPISREHVVVDTSKLTDEAADAIARVMGSE